MNVLITGGSGFLGSHLTRRMVADGHQVRILSRRPPPAPAEHSNVEWILGDVVDPEGVERAVRGSEYVVHAAARANSMASSRETTLVMQVNVEGTKNLARACRKHGIRRLVHVSSVLAVGIPSDPRFPADESFSFNLENSGLTYHLSKRRAEEAVMAGVVRGLDAVIVNPARLWGPSADGYRGAEMLKPIRRSHVVPHFTGGGCMVHVEDVVGGILAALDRGETGQRYILGGENLSFREMLGKTASRMGLERRFVAIPRLMTGLAAAGFEPWGWLRKRQPRISLVTYRCAHLSQFYDSSKARRTLGYVSRDFDAILNECLTLGAC